MVLLISNIAQECEPIMLEGTLGRMYALAGVALLHHSQYMIEKPTPCDQ